jgi:hypothetical protein
LKIHAKNISGTAFPGILKLCGSLIASCSLLIFSQLAANATTISGDSTTILRMRESTGERDLYPLYEYLHLAGTDAGKNGAVSFFLGGWGRADLGDESTHERTNGDLQYGFLSYRSNRNNLLFNAGRQFVAEGVASEKIDGLYLRSDLAAGFTAAAFVGSPVVTEPSFTGGDTIFGARLAHSAANFYTLGVSFLQNRSGGGRLREEEGIDLWLHPVQQIDIAGRSSYNSLTDGWMEHSYTASLTPMDALRVSASLEKINYRDFFHHVTTSALSLTNGILSPNEESLMLGGSVGFTPTKSLALSGEYKRFNYDIAGDADYYGANLSVSTPTRLSAGASFHRMDGSNSRFQYNEFRVYATQKMGAADLTLDFIDIDFDHAINGRKNTYSLAAAAGYDVSKDLRVAADLDYQRSADFDHEFRGLVKMVYAFDSERRGK